MMSGVPFSGVYLPSDFDTLFRWRKKRKEWRGKGQREEKGKGTGGGGGDVIKEMVLTD